MAVHVLDAMAREGFEEVVAINDHRTGLRAFLAIHDTRGGPAMGGIRRYTYRDEKEALLDCLRLALHMSFKCILAGIPGGGAKTVIMDRPEMDLEGAYRHLGNTIERMQGRYLAGPDIGSGARELDWVSEQTRYASRPEAALGEGPGDLGGATAGGVFAGMESALVALDGEVDWKNRRVVIQGLGSVGSILAKRLVSQGAHVLASDLDGVLAARAAKELGVELIEAGQAATTPCDIFSPCALGGILHDVSIPKLAARIVCGAANNQLARARHAERMHSRGVLYVPDFVVNSGAVMLGSAYHARTEAFPPALSLAQIESRIGALVREVLGAAQVENEAPARTAERRARKALAARRDGAQEHSAASLSPQKKVDVGASARDGGVAAESDKAPGQAPGQTRGQGPDRAPGQAKLRIEIP